MLPASLYIHTPWCIRKCPYCDFNSHKSPDTLPEKSYIDALLADFKQDFAEFPDRQIHSVFIGGGTPSLLSAESYHRLFTELRQLISFTSDAEITLEANPGTVEQQRFTDYHAVGINRLSLGIQSFNPRHLQKLGRIHDEKQANKAIEAARLAGFTNINLDIMHGLPDQSVEEGLADLQQALDWQPEHLSWYQLTLEPNTVFYKQRPPLPSEEDNEALERIAFERFAAAGFARYEISAFCKIGKESQHNLNYWLFGDYYGIGAGAHGKITLVNKQIIRTQKYRQPSDYLQTDKKFMAQKEVVDPAMILFEFMLNTTRLQQPIPNALFTEKTGLELDYLMSKLQQAVNKGLVTKNETHWQVTELGRRFTNNLQEMFLPD